MKVVLSFLVGSGLAWPPAVMAFAPATNLAFRSKHPASSSALRYADDEDTSQVPVLAFEPWKFLDFNNDGRVDVQDISFLVATAFDVNGDGKVDAMDGHTFLSVMMMSWILMASPVGAKGGGGGGGGGSHSSSASSYQPHYASYRRSNRRLANRGSVMSRPRDPMGCSDLPVEGELLDVLVDNYLGTYVPGVVASVHESNCRFQADLMGEGKYFQYQGSKALSSNRNWMNWVFPVFFGAAVGGSFIEETVRSKDVLVNLKWEDDFDEAFFREQREHLNEEYTRPAPPCSGCYVGSTSESDGMAQGVKTHLQFHESGKITGSGIDSEDGSYMVVGSCNNRKVRWTEHYSFFSATVRGEISERTGSMRCRFNSTRGIRGRFTIRKKKV
jgi:hypothetical protein